MEGRGIQNELEAEIPGRSINILPGGLPKAITCYKDINAYTCGVGELEKIGFGFCVDST